MVFMDRSFGGRFYCWATARETACIRPVAKWVAPPFASYWLVKLTARAHVRNRLLLFFTTSTGADVIQSAGISWERLPRRPTGGLALENAGAILVREETGVAQIEGLSAWSKVLQRPIVLLASDKDNGFRSRFDAAHELGHLVLHRHIPRATERLRHNEMERQAHRFAGAFLLPAESFSAEFRFPATLDSLLLMKQRWGVSVGALIMRLDALGLIDENDKLSLFKRRSARWGAKSEPGDDGRAPERPRLLRRTVELHLSSNIIPADGFSRHLGLSRRDIEMLAGLPESFLEGRAEGWTWLRCGLSSLLSCRRKAKEALVGQFCRSIVASGRDGDPVDPLNELPSNNDVKMPSRLGWHFSGADC